MLRAITFGLLVLPASAALAEGHSIGLKVGAFGLGAEYTHELTDRLAVRGALYGSQLGFDVEESGIEYQADVVWDSLTAGIDFHPLKSALRLSLGIMKNDNALELVSRPTTNQTIGDTTYTPAQIGTLTGSLHFDDTAPFAGLGWDWSRDARLFGMSLDIGVVNQGDAVVTLRGNGNLLGNPAFEQDINAEAAELAAEGSDFDLVPFLSVGFQFRF
ncbi:MAG TPA: hypothetical protein VM692_02370 [Gammaproteobacteria bacterium]|nr:hypothetical protein [Gammaproteobacteria bacterium]